MPLIRNEPSRKLILAAVVAATLSACSNSPKSASREFYSAIGNGNADKAMKLIDTAEVSPSAQGMVVNSKLRAAIDSIHQRAEAHGGLKRVKILSTQRIDDTHSKVTAEMDFKDGTSQTETDTWIKLHGKWLLDTAQD